MDRLEIIPERVWECFHTVRRYKHPSSITEVSIPERVWREHMAALLLPSNSYDSG
jgi:hypothetical protein